MPPVAIDRFAEALARIRADLNEGAKAGAPGCLLVVLTAIGGAVALTYAFTWEPGWHTDPATLGGIVAYIAAVWLVWKAGLWWAEPGAAVSDRASRRLETDVLSPLIAEMRPGARYIANAQAPARTLARSRIVRDRPFTSANQIRWRAGDLEMEMFEVDCIVSSDSSSPDRYFVGLLAWADVPDDHGGVEVVVRSRHEFRNGVAGPGETTALDGFAVNGHYRVMSNWAPFAREVCTPQLQDRLLQLAAEDVWVHAAVADSRVWVGIEAETDSWFRHYPNRSLPLLGALDSEYLALLERQITIVEELATELARAARTARR